MTESVALDKISLTLSCELAKLPFSDGFLERFSRAASSFEDFLCDPRLNGFTDQYQANPHYSFNVTLCGDQRMQELNREYREKDKTTDVLTLALYDDIRAGDELLFEEVDLGDIFISAPVMEKQADEFKVTIEQEFFHLMVHGFLHLLGFDHEISEDEEQLMEGYEKQLVDDIYSKLYGEG